MEPFEVKLVAFKNSGGQKLFYIKKEKNYLSDLSQDIRNSFPAKESFFPFSFILESQRGDVCCSVANFVNLISVFEELFI